MVTNDRITIAMVLLVLALAKPNLGAEPNPADSRRDAQRLAEEATKLENLGQWDEAAARIEAALLIESKVDFHARAVVAYYHLTMRDWHRSGPSADWETKARGLNHFVRGLRHLEACRVKVADVQRLPPNMARCLSQYPGLIIGMETRRGWTEEIKDTVEKTRRTARETFHRILINRAKAGHFDLGDKSLFSGTFYGGAPAKERLEVTYKTLVEVQDYPFLEKRALAFFSATRLSKCPEGVELATRMEQSKNDAMRAAGARIRKHIQLIQAVPKSNVVIDGPKPIPGTQAVQFKMIDFPVVTREGKQRTLTGFLGCIPVGEDLEVIWDRKGVYTVPKEGPLKELWGLPEHDKSRITNVAFDGRYVWVPVSLYKDEPYLLVIDPRDGTLRKLTKSDGLPVQPPKSLSRGSQYFMAAGIAPGRACLAGWFGKSWIAAVACKPSGDGAPRVNVFHEAPRVTNIDSRQGWRDSGIAFHPQGMLTLATGPLTDPHTDRRIFIERHAGGDAFMSAHPLLVDPETQKVMVMEQFFAPRYRTLHDGAIYFVALHLAQKPHIHLSRFGLPELKPTVVLENVREGWPLLAGNHLHLAGQRWWRTRRPSKSLPSAGGEPQLLGDVPWFFQISLDIFPERRPHERSTVGALHLDNVWHSRRYGILAVVHTNFTAPHKDRLLTYQVSIRGADSTSSQ